MTTAQLEYLDELIARDAAAAATLDELDGLLRRVASVRDRAERVQRELDLGPAEITQREREAQEAGERLDAARARREELEQNLAAARQSADEGTVREAEQAVVAARDSVHMAERAASESEKALGARREQLAHAESERPLIDSEVAALAEALDGRPRLPAQISSPPAELSGVSAWAIEARAALVVARSTVTGEREQVIRQAGELAALVTGSAQPAGSMATIAAAIRGAT